MSITRRTLPRSVSPLQLRAVCDVLGLPAEDVRMLMLDPRDGVTVDLYHRDETGALIAGYDQLPLTSNAHIPLDFAPEPSTPPSSYCEPEIITQIRELEDEDGWRRGESTGRACVVCPCGLITGWIPTDQAQRIRDAHTRDVQTKPEE